MQRGAAVRPGWRFSARDVHPRNPPPPDLARPRRIGHVDTDKDMIEEPIQKRGGVSVASPCPPDAMQTEPLDLHEPNRAWVGGVRDIVNPHARGKIFAPLAVARRIHL